MSEPWYIKARRLAKDMDLSYQSMADALGVQKSTVGHWMTGRHFPSLARLEKIAAMLNTSVPDLVADDDRFARDELESNLLHEIRETPAEYRAQALAMLRAYRASLPEAPPKDG
jgi:transcriptional regulator with XRE-family HTH domain